MNGSHTSSLWWWCSVTVVVALCQCGSSLELGNCNRTLGMENGAIKDGSIVASSSFDSHNTGPQNARLNQDRHGGAWCPKPAIRENVKEWIQINLQHVHVLTGVVTQGRYGKGKGQEYMTEFMVEYSRPSIGGWRTFVDRLGNQVFNANRDTVTSNWVGFDPPIFASQIRVVPHSKHPRIVCMRLELLGCQFTGGTLAYSSPPPDLMGSSNISREDLSIWGRQDHGLLIDGSLGDVETRTVGTYDQGWMSWKKKGPRPIELIFQFDAPRNFTKITIFTSNLFHLGVQVFAKAMIWFSVGGKYYPWEPVVYEYMPDSFLKEARNVSVMVSPPSAAGGGDGSGQGAVGQFVKIHLFFANTWMSVSEVTFATSGDPVPDGPRRQALIRTEESARQGQKQTPHRGDSNAPLSGGEDDGGVWGDRPQGPTRPLDGGIERGSWADIEPGGGGSGGGGPDPPDGAGSSGPPVQQAAAPVDVEVVIGVLTAVTLLLMFLFAAVLVYSRRQKFLLTSSPAVRGATAAAGAGNAGSGVGVHQAHGGRSLNPLHISMKEFLINMSSGSGGQQGLREQQQQQEQTRFNENGRDSLLMQVATAAAAATASSGNPTCQPQFPDYYESEAVVVLPKGYNSTVKANLKSNLNTQGGPYYHQPHLAKWHSSSTGNVPDHILTLNGVGRCRLAQNKSGAAAVGTYNHGKHSQHLGQQQQMPVNITANPLLATLAKQQQVTVSEYASVDVRDIGSGASPGLLIRADEVGDGPADGLAPVVFVGGDTLMQTSGRVAPDHHHLYQQGGGVRKPLGQLKSPAAGFKRKDHHQQQQQQQQIYNLGQCFPRVLSEPPPRKTYLVNGGGKDWEATKGFLPMAETAWNLTTNVQAICQLPNLALPEIPRNQLRLRESFGKGCLGEVIVCETESDYSNIPRTVALRSNPWNSGQSCGNMSSNGTSASPSASYASSSAGSSSAAAAAATAANEVPPSAVDREATVREWRLLASLKHQNIARLIGVSMAAPPEVPPNSPRSSSSGSATSSASLCAVLEHSPQGDLWHYLRQMSGVAGSADLPATTLSSSSSASSSSESESGNGGPCSITYLQLLDMIAQVASGMKYLESRSIVHRDLAAR